MYISKFVIRNFRVFDEEGISLKYNKGVNAIIGENNSGKSAVLDALRIVYSTLTYRKDIFFTKTDFHVRADGTLAEYAQFDIYLKEVLPRLVEIWDPQSADAQGGEFHIRFEKSVLPNGKEKIKVLHWGIGGEGNVLSSDTFDAIEIMFLGALRDSENEMRPAKNSKLAQLLRNLVPDEITRQGLVKVLNDANGELLEKEELKKTRDTINSNLERIEKEFLNQKIDIGLIEPRFDSIASSLRAWVKPKWILISKSDKVYSDALSYWESHAENKKVKQNDQGIYFEVSIVESEKDISDVLTKRIDEIASGAFELYQNGLGYNNLLFMSAVLGDMTIAKGGVYQKLLLIEEPEAHLHPQLQELVHSFLTVTNQEDADIQIIYTSHSPTLAAKIDIDNINLIYESNYKKYCLPFSDANLEETDKEYLKRYLDVTKSQMFFAKGIIFVEGISEAILLPEIARLLDRPLEKYAVELVNVDSVAFNPFVNLLSSESVKTCFSRVAIITDDDRCTRKSEEDCYIDKNLDYSEVTEAISNKLLNGTPSERCINLESLCRSADINIYKATKTLEYAMCNNQKNVDVYIEAIKKFYPEEGVKLETKVKSLNKIDEKAACIWLFIRARNKCKGAIAQYIANVIKEQYDKKAKGDVVDKEFIVPEYLKEAVYCVTEK